jgi:thiamine-monophosphate kinase
VDNASARESFRLQAGEEAIPASEQEILALVDGLFPSRTPHTPLGRGHDCAELHSSGPLALSTDMFWQDTHFRTSYFTPREAGAKALATAVSDLAAAGAEPLGFSLGLLLPRGICAHTISGLLTGMADKAQEYGMTLTGGDLAGGTAIGFSLTVWGRPVESGIPFLRRLQPEPGDLLFLIGPSGLARVGLWALEQYGRAALHRWPAACAAHLNPRPLLAEGQTLARLAGNISLENTGRETRLSLMDLSDGLARDLPRLLHGLGANLDFSPSLIAKEVTEAAPHMHCGPEEIFLLGGEDYALLGSCPEELMPRIADAVPAVRPLGRVQARAGLFRAGKELCLDGFDHFLPQRKNSGSSVFPPDSRTPPAYSRHGAPEDGMGLQAGIADHKGSCDDRIHAVAQSIVAVCRKAWQAGLMAGFNGNASCRMPPEAFSGWGDETPFRCREAQEGSEPHVKAGDDAHTPVSAKSEFCLITRSGAAKGSLRHDDFALLSLPGGDWIDGPPASSERALHTKIYALRPQSRAVLHTHPPCLLALALALEPEKRLDLPLTEASAYATRVAWTPFHPPGSRELAETVAKAAQTYDAVWMERHGLVVHGPDLSFALSLTEELEQLAKVHLALLASRQR